LPATTSPHALAHVPTTLAHVPTTLAHVPSTHHVAHHALEQQKRWEQQIRLFEHKEQQQIRLVEHQKLQQTKLYEQQTPCVWATHLEDL
jgi:hypothetical protein